MARILMIDDDENVGIIVRERLETHGHEVIWTGSGKVGLDMFYKTDYDLVILDLHMPEMDGYEVCDNIKDSSKGNVPVLFLSGYINEEGFHQKNRADGYLSKPFSDSELLNMVRGLLDRST